MNDFTRLYELIYGEEHPEWKKWDGPYFPHEQISYTQFEEQLLQRINRTGPVSIAVLEVQGQIIGTVTYYWEHQPSRWLEIGIVIYEPAYWSGGYGSEALRLWIGHLFQHLPLVRIGLTTWSGNQRMIRCAKKLGMREEARIRKARFYNGEYYDSVKMGMLREEWEEATQGGE